MGFPHNLVVKVVPEYVGRNVFQPEDFFPLHVANIVASLDHLSLVAPAGPKFDSTFLFFFHSKMHAYLDVVNVVELGTAVFLLGRHRLQSSEKHRDNGFQVVEGILVVQPCVGVYILCDS